jgi:hypothetical protein
MSSACSPAPSASWPGCEACRSPQSTSKILENAGLVSRRKTGRTTYLVLNPRRLRLLQDWTGQFHTYWGSDQASFENYRSYLDSDPRHR